jgi:hypothetical protein
MDSSNNYGDRMGLNSNTGYDMISGWWFGT